MAPKHLKTKVSFFVVEFYINVCTAIVEYKRNRALIFFTEVKKLCVFTQGCVQMPLFLPCNTVEVEAEMVCASDLRALCNSQEPGHVYKNKSNARADTRPAPIALSPAAVNKATLLLHCKLTTLHTYVRYVSAMSVHGQLLGPWVTQWPAVISP